MSQGDSMDRRTFYLTFIYGAWAVMGTVLGLLGGVYLLWPPPFGKGDEWVEAGSLSQLKLNTPEQVVFRHNRFDGWKLISEKATAWVVKRADNRVIAFAPQCPHLGCAYHWDQQNQDFLCPCHASRFSIEGEVLTGPAQRSLDQYEVKIEGGKLLVGRVHKSEETPG